MTDNSDNENDKLYSTKKIDPSDLNNSYDELRKKYSEYSGENKVSLSDLYESKEKSKDNLNIKKNNNPPKKETDINMSAGKSKKQNPRKKNTVKINTSKTVIMILAIVMACSVLISTYTLSCINDVLAFSKSTDMITVTIPNGATTSDVIDLLHDKKLIKHPYFCKFFSKLRKYSDKYQSGMFHLKPKMGIEGMLNSLKVNSQTEETVKLTFPEGWTVMQIINKLDENKVCSKEDLLQTIKETNFDTSLLKDIKNNDKRYQKLEGYMCTDTYEFYVGENPSSVIKRFLNNSENKFTPEYRARAKELGMSTDQVITLASLIQKEAADDDQMSYISSVLHNRLKNLVDFPLLQCDSTITYINENIRPYVSNDAEAYNNYYNTYKCQGLPAGPICNPSVDAIKAALYPKKTSYLYFNHDVNGKLYLAKTLQQHNDNIAKAAAVQSSENTTSNNTNNSAGTSLPSDQ